MIAALVALGGASLIIFCRARGIFGDHGVRPRQIAAALLWLVAGVSFWLAMQSDGFDVAQTGVYSSGWRQLGVGLLFGVLNLLTFPLYVGLARKFGGAPPATDSLAIIASASLSQRLFMLGTAAGAEEIIFRAVPIGSLMAAGVPHLAAVLIPLAVFVLLHRSAWGGLHLFFVTVAGVLMTGAYLYGGLWAAVIAHLILDAPLMLAAKAISERQGRASGAAQESE